MFTLKKAGPGHTRRREEIQPEGLNTHSPHACVFYTFLSGLTQHILYVEVEFPEGKEGVVLPSLLQHG
jgi:hypothetical protein